MNGTKNSRVTIGKHKTGFVLGKFMPPHKGHEFLCTFGAEYVEQLTILVCSLPTEPIDGKLRFKWMKQMFPHCRVLHCDEILPQVPEEHPDFWNIWKDVIKRYHPEPLDVIFASEPYGLRLAKDQNCQFVPCDIARSTIGISATEIRNDPYSNWEFIPDVVKNYYSKRICLVGVESTGKTTLGKQLAEIHNGVFLPEYGRTYTEFFGSNVDSTDMMNIVNGHIASRKAIERIGSRLIIEDTDPVMSAVWADMLTGKRDPWFETFDDYADFYLLCDIDINWVDDGTRYFSNSEDRKRFHDKVVQELENRNLPYALITGQGNERYDNALVATRKYLRTIQTVV